MPEYINTIEYPNWYPKLDKEKARKITHHCEEHNIEPNVCAYYKDWNDFCSDWVDGVGYSEGQAEELLREGKVTGEFLEFKNWGILRFAM